MYNLSTANNCTVLLKYRINYQNHTARFLSELLKKTMVQDFHSKMVIIGTVHLECFLVSADFFSATTSIFPQVIGVMRTAAKVDHHIFLLPIVRSSTLAHHPSM